MLLNMGIVRQKYSRSSVSTSQITVLDLIYKYRFVSSQLVADTLDIHTISVIYRRLEVLVKYGYVNKRFDKRLKLVGVPAAYYLTPKGLRMLQGLPNHQYVSETVIKASYRDKSVGQEFVTHTLNVYRATNLLKQQYPSLKVFTKRDICQYDYFPSQLPDAFLSLPTDNLQQPKRFFFDLVSDSLPRTALDRRIANYCEFFDEGGWDETGSELPILLLLSEWGAAEGRIQRNVRVQLSRSDMEELSVYTSTLSALEHVADEGAIWTGIEDMDELKELAVL